MLKESGGDSRVVAALIGDDAINSRVARTAKDALPTAKVIATASDPGVADELTDAGVRAITPALSTLVVLENLVRHPDLFGLLAEDSDEVRVEDVYLTNMRYSGAKVRDLPLPEGVLAIGIFRTGERLVPRGTTVLAAGDRLTLVGPPEPVQVALERIGGTVAPDA